jgi:hypothetical protein
MGDPADFLDRENWSGSHITMAIQLGPSTAPDADQRALRALRAVWGHPSMQGPYPDCWSAVGDQDPAPPVPSTFDEPEHLCGLAVLPDGQRVVCFTVISRGSYRDGCDWLALCLPSGALGRAGIHADYLPTLVPDELRYWQDYMGAWFVPIAQAVQRQAGFRLAVLGEEAPITAPWLPDGPFPLDGHVPGHQTGAYLIPTATGIEYHGPTNGS